MGDLKVIIPKGTKIICPNCKTEIAIVQRDIHLGDAVMAKDFEGIGFEIKAGDTPQCPKRGEWYLKGYWGE